MRTSTRLAVMLAAAAAVTACEQKLPLESGASTIVVHAVLNPSVRDQYVVVQRTTNGAPAAPAVAGATVTITGPDGVAMLATEDRDTSVVNAAAGNPAIGLVYRVSLDIYSDTLRPGGTYSLRIVMPTSEVVTGTTTIPSSTPAAAPADTTPFDPARDTLSLMWGSVAGAQSYEVRVSSTARTYALFTDGSIALPGTRLTLEGAAVFAPGLTNTAVVTAVDRNYYEYYVTNSDPFTGATVAGNLTGAQGVFGSVVILVVKEMRVTP